MFTVTVPPRHAAVRYIRGRRDGVLPAGRHWRRFGQRLTVVDLRDRLLPLAMQEVRTADAVSVRVSATLRVAVTDPPSYCEVSQDPHGLVYLAAQLELRDAMAALTAEQLSGRDTDVVDLTAGVDEVARTVGMTVRQVMIKDLLLPVELRSAALELFSTRHHATVQLEKARAEAAVLRSLANSAKLLDQHPALARLRMVQGAPAGATVVLHLADGSGDGTAGGRVSAS